MILRSNIYIPTYSAAYHKEYILQTVMSFANISESCPNETKTCFNITKCRTQPNSEVLLCAKWYRKNIRFIALRFLLIIWFIALHATVASNVPDINTRDGQISLKCVHVGCLAIKLQA